MNKKYSFKLLLVFIVVFMCISVIGAFIKVMAVKNEETCLIGKTILIDPGHGGKDNGASVDGIMEDVINMKISGYLFESLLNSGANVLISRTSDYDLASLYQKNRKKEDLANRAKYINKIKPDIFISIHLNTYPDNNVNGAQVFYQDNQNSKQLADCIQNKLNILTSKNRKVKIGDYFILNQSKYTGVLIECGFLSNSIEREKLDNDDYQQKIANRIKLAIVDYFYIQ